VARVEIVDPTDPLDLLVVREMLERTVCVEPLVCRGFLDCLGNVVWMDVLDATEKWDQLAQEELPVYSA